MALIHPQASAMRRKAIPVKNGAEQMIAAGRAKPAGPTIDLNDASELQLSAVSVKIAHGLTQQ